MIYDIPRKILVFLFIILSISGCSTTADFIDADGNIYTAKIKGLGEATYKDGDKEFTVKGKPMIEIPQLPKLEFQD